MATAFSLYDILGVERDASEAQIRSAFRKLTFKHHPDRYAVDDRPKAEERFQEITEAFNVLSHPESRKKYDEELAQGQLGGSGAMDSKEIARRLAAKGSQTMREGRLTDALNELKSALDHDEECSRAHFFMGVTLAKVGGGREKDALRHLERATNLDPLRSRERCPQGRDEGQGAAVGRRGVEFRPHQQEGHLGTAGSADCREHTVR